MKKPKVVLAACYLTQERHQCFSSGLHLRRLQCLQPKDSGSFVCVAILSIYLDSFVGETQMPLLQQGPPLAFETYFSGSTAL